MSGPPYPGSHLSAHAHEENERWWATPEGRAWRAKWERPHGQSLPLNIAIYAFIFVPTALTLWWAL